MICASSRLQLEHGIGVHARRGRFTSQFLHPQLPPRHETDFTFPFIHASSFHGYNDRDMIKH